MSVFRIRVGRALGLGMSARICVEASPAAAYRVTSARLAQSIPLLALIGDLVPPGNFIEDHIFHGAPEDSQVAVQWLPPA